MKIQKKTGIDSLKLLCEAQQKSGSTYLPNADYIAEKISYVGSFFVKKTNEKI